MPEISDIQFWIPEDFGFKQIFFGKKWRKGHYELLYFNTSGKWLLRKQVIDKFGKPSTLITFYLVLPESYSLVNEIFELNGI